MQRVATHRYTDPLDRIWLTAAERIGIRVRRGGEAYASTTGDGSLALAGAEHLDADDSLAQMILHEVCHSLVQGEASFRERDWGLDNETSRDVPREKACLRVQAALAGAFGLRRLLAPTTDFRAFYDALASDPFEPRVDPTTALAILGRQRADKPPWAPHLGEALRATRIVAEQAALYATRDPSGTGVSDFWTLVDPAPAPHPTGLAGRAPGEDRTCGSCAWRQGKSGRCRQSGQRVSATTAACERWEPALDCRDCGACCRAAYDCVQVTARDPVRKKHPELVVLRGPFLEIARRGERCAALRGGIPEGDSDEATSPSPYTCIIYGDRPKSCRDFEVGGPHCLTARRRVGLSL